MIITLEMWPQRNSNLSTTKTNALVLTDGVDTPLGVVLSAATDNHTLRSSLSRRGIELICAHKKNRKKRRLQDGRKLRRSRHRWKIERTISWLKSYRRLSTRYEYYADLFLGFAQLACMFTILKRF